MVLFLSFNAFAVFLSAQGWASDWLCVEASSVRINNTIRACGVGEGRDENEARSVAFDNASAEFKRVCDPSIDCNHNAINVEPARTSCERTEAGYKCYRMVVFSIQRIHNYKTAENDSESGPGKIYKGMTKKQLFQSFGTPAAIYDNDDMRGYTFKGEVAALSDQSCLVVVQNEIVISYSHCKTEYIADL